MSSVAAKVAPRSLNQVRNLTYFLVAWAGFMRGSAEKRKNDALWLEYQQKVRKQNVERIQAATAARDALRDRELESTIPAIVPEPLHQVYKEIEKAAA